MNVTMQGGIPALKFRRVGTDMNQPIRKVAVTDTAAQNTTSSKQQSTTSSADSKKKALLTRQTLCRFIQLTFTKNKKANYQRLISELDFSAKFKPESAKQWYGALTECVSIMKYGSMTGPSSASMNELWKTIFDKFRWDFPLDALTVYTGFLCELVNRHPSSLRRVISNSVKYLRQVSMSAVTASVLRRYPIDSELLSLDNTSAEVWNGRVALIHKLLRELYQLRPTLSSLLFQELVDCFPKPYAANGGIDALIGSSIPPPPSLPSSSSLITDNDNDDGSEKDEFKLPPLLEGVIAQGAIGVAEFIRLGKAADEWVCYSQQLFAVIHYMPELRDKIIQLLIERLILLDMTAQKKMESGPAPPLPPPSDSTSNNMINLSVSEKMLRSMDEVMLVFFEYIQIISKHESQLSCVFRSLLRTFESCILTSVEVSHVPFILFYISHCKMKFGDELISRLLCVIQDVSISTFERCSAVAYLAAFVNKAEFISVSITMYAFEILLQWCHGYCLRFAKNRPLLFVGTTTADDEVSHSLSHPSDSDDSSNLSDVISSNCCISVTVSEAKQHVLFYAVCQALFKILIAKQCSFDEHFDQRHYYDDSSSLTAAHSDSEDVMNHSNNINEEECLMDRKHKWEMTPQKKERKYKRVCHLRQHMYSVINSPLSPLRFMNSNLISAVVSALNHSILFGADSNNSNHNHHSNNNKNHHNKLSHLHNSLLKNQCVDWQSFGGTFVKLQSEPFKEYSLPKSKKRLDCLFTLRKSSVIGTIPSVNNMNERQLTQDALDNATQEGDFDDAISIAASAADDDIDDVDDPECSRKIDSDMREMKSATISNRKRKLSDARGTDSNDCSSLASDSDAESVSSSNSSSAANHAEMMAMVESQVNPKHALTPSLASVDAETESVMHSRKREELEDQKSVTQSGSDPPMLILDGCSLNNNGSAEEAENSSEDEDSDDTDDDDSSSSSANDFSMLLTTSPKI